jgi:glutaminyl-peptide cyclotransferase
MGRRVIPHRYDWRMLLTMIGAPVAIVTTLGIALLLLVPPPPSEAQPPMHPKPAPIDGRRAYGYLEEICKIGPRVAGTEANTRQRQMVAEHFKKRGLTVREQPFVAAHPLTGRRVDMANLIGSWQPERLHRLVLCAHYDTRPHADEEINPDRLDKPFIGANDGASGVALLMEIANHLDRIESPYGIDLVLFDGEELVFGNNPRRGEYFLGSTVFARSYAAQRSDRSRARVQYVGGILFDMVGGKDMQIRREPNSMEMAPDLMREVWGVAHQLRARSFSNAFGREVLDDHLPMNRAGIPTIDLIDFEYPHWHKIDDVPENCSPESLDEVGRVVTGWLSLPRHGRK